MRIERTYWLHQCGTGDPEREEFSIECTESRFCEDPACEAQHEDPAALWDMRVSFSLGSAFGQKNADTILDALQAKEAAERKPAEPSACGASYRAHCAMPGIPCATHRPTRADTAKLAARG